MFNIHWNIRGTPEHKAWGFYESEKLEFSYEFVVEVLTIFHTYYARWAFFYYLIILVICKERIKRNNSWTMIQWQTDTSKNGSRLREKYGNWASIIYFIGLHYTASLVFIFVAMPGLFSYWCSLFLLVLYTLGSYKNSASYYIDYFSKKYLVKIEELDKLEQTYLNKPDSAESELKNDKKSK